MARIGENAFRQYVDGQDRLTAREYTAERELIRQAINDVEDKYEIVNDVRQEIQNVDSTLNQGLGQVNATVQETKTLLNETKAYIEQVKSEIGNGGGGGGSPDDGNWDEGGGGSNSADDGEWD